MVLAKLTPLATLFAIACGGPTPDVEAGTFDASIGDAIADRDAMVDAGETCDADPQAYAPDGQQPAELLTCCAGTICNGTCISGTCTCGKLLGGCSPYGCCTHADAAPSCMLACGGPTK